MERNNFHDYFSLIRRFNFSTIPKEERKLDTKAIAWISNDFFFFSSEIFQLIHSLLRTNNYKGVWHFYSFREEIIKIPIIDVLVTTLDPPRALCSVRERPQTPRARHGNRHRQVFQPSRSYYIYPDGELHAAMRPPSLRESSYLHQFA